LNWYEWFNFSSDPFIVTPLQSDEEFNTLFVKTDLVNKELSYISSQVVSDPFLLLTIGNRGVGKSTILQYVVNLCRKNDIISVYVGLLPYGIKSSREPVYELSRQIMKSLIQELILEVFMNRNDFFQKYNRNFISWGKYVGLSYDDIEGFYRDPGYQLDFSVLRDVLFGIIELINRNNMKILIAIDNLDKLESDVVVNFLKGGTAQPLLENLNNSGASVLIASDPRTADIIDKDVDLSYLRRRIEISPLSPIEAEQLISLRVSRYSRSQSSNCYDKRAIFYVCNTKAGITRDIINEVRKLFEKSYKENTKYVTYELALEGSEKIDEREIYYNIIKENTSRKGAEKLLNFVYSIPEGRENEVAGYLYSIFEGKRLRIPGPIMHALLNNNIIYSDISLPRGYQLDLDVYHLFNSLITTDWNLVDFLKWIFKIDTLNIVRIQTPGSKGYSWVNKMLKELLLFDFPNNRISVIRNDNYMYYDSGEWKIDIISKLRKLNNYYEELNNTDIEDADVKTLLNLIYIILKNYLLVTIKIISAISEKPIKFESDNPNIDNWRFIWAGIRYYQRYYDYWFKTYKNIGSILNSYDKMKKDSIIPSFSEIEQILFSLEDIILEFSNEIDNILADKKLLNDDIKLYPEVITLIKNRLDDALLNMGYEDNLEIYKNIFKDNINKIVNDDTFIEDNLIFVRQRIKKINNKKSKHYFICFINKLNYQISNLKMIQYVNAFTKIINIVEKNDIKEILKNRYIIGIFSLQGYEKEASEIIKKTKIPIRTQIQLLNAMNINTYLVSNNVTPINSELLLSKFGKEIAQIEEKIPHVLILYRSGNILSEGSAKKISDYLTEKNIKICLFKKEVGWGDSITNFEEEAIDNAFATVICYTKDFKEGKTTAEEYRAVLAKRRSNPNFKVGLLLIDCTEEDIPPFMKDYFYAKIKNLQDEEFEGQAEIIYRGLLDLPIE